MLNIYKWIEVDPWLVTLDIGRIYFYQKDILMFLSKVLFDIIKKYNYKL